MFDQTKLTFLQRRAVQRPFTNDRGRQLPPGQVLAGGFTVALSLNR
jgi:hypothetical protein